MYHRYRPTATLYQASIPSVIWAEDAIRQFGCHVLVGHLFLVVPDPTTAHMCLLGSGEYAEVGCGTACRDESLLPAAPRLMPIADSHDLPLVLLRASDWTSIPPISLSHDPQFPALDTLLSSLLGTWLQQPYSRFSSRLATWITSIYGARADPALVAPAEGGTLGPYLRLSRTIPARLRQLHVDLVHKRVFMLAYAAHVYYSSVAQTVDRRAASGGDLDPIDVPPSIEEIGKGSNPSFWKPTPHDKRALG